ncbi:hypothetical protein NXS19_003768 [Fusarium pseudograminearum]|nr:hypothetical protein NXS19_003768 [Fusarium pseudograminearum]
MSEADKDEKFSNFSNVQYSQPELSDAEDDVENPYQGGDGYSQGLPRAPMAPPSPTLSKKDKKKLKKQKDKATAAAAEQAAFMPPPPPPPPQEPSAQDEPSASSSSKKKSKKSKRKDSKSLPEPPSIPFPHLQLPRRARSRRR